MHKQRTHWQWLIGCAMVILLASGCFQPAGTNPQSLSVAQSGVTFTPPPTNLPPPTLTPETIIVTSVVVATPDASIFQVPTAAFIPTLDTSGSFQQPLTQQQLDPLDVTATFIVQQATDIAGFQLTATACALGLCVPTSTPLPPLVPTIAPVAGIPGVDCIHEVRAEDKNLYRISLKYGVTVDQIARASGIVNPDAISIGERLTIPGCGTTGAIPPATSTPATGAVNPGLATATPVPVGGTVSAGTTYTVQQGDTLYAISVQTGVPVASIAAANNIANVDRILINQQLIIPSR